MRTLKLIPTDGHIGVAMLGGLILFTIILLLAGCSNSSDSLPDNPVNDPSNEQIMSANDSVKNVLQFSNSEDEQRFQCIYDQFSASAQADGLTGNDMEHFELDKMVAKLWCDGKGSKDSISCQNPFFSGPLRNAGSQFMLVQTSVVDTFPNVTGTVESYGRNPVDGPWGIDFRRTRTASTNDNQTGGGSSAGSMSISFSRLNDEGEFRPQLSFEQNIAYPFGAEPVSVDLPGNTLDDFTQLSASPELFVTTFEARYDVLQAEIERQFESGELIDDTGKELSNALAFIEEKREVIRSNAPQLHALLTSGVDLTRCQ